MIGYLCCEIISSSTSQKTTGARIANGGPRPLRQRFLHISKWVVPSTVLVLLPKCPACLVVYLAIGTGIGMSVSAAVYVRIVLVTLCMGSLLYFAVKHGNLRTLRTQIVRRLRHIHY